MEERKTNYVVCLQCKENINTSDLKLMDNNTKAECPYCGCKMTVEVEGPLTETKLLKLLGED